MQIISSPLFGSHIPFARAKEFEATIAHPERVAYRTVSAGADCDKVYMRYPTRAALLQAIYKTGQRGLGTPVLHELVQCPHGVRAHC